MKRTVFNDASNAVTPLFPDQKPEDKLLPCTFCGESTQRKILAAFGARCERCYGNYCCAAPSHPGAVSKSAIVRRLSSMTMQQCREQPKSWAEKLKAREENGERLSPVQSEMWRSVIHGALGFTRAQQGEIDG